MLTSERNPESHITRSYKLLGGQLAFHADFDELMPGSKYFFVYSLVTPENVVLEKFDGSFTTFENKLENLKFSASSGSRLFSESEAFSLLV